MPPENNNTEILDNITLQNKELNKEFFLEEEKKVEKFKNNPDIYNRAKEELNELKKGYKNLTEGNGGKISSLKKEFNLDIKGLNNISKIASKDFIEKLGNNTFNNIQEEKIYKLFKRTSILKDYLDNGLKLPENTNDFDRFLNDLELRKKLKKEYKKFSKNLSKIDFSSVPENELKDYINQIKKYKLNINTDNINNEKIKIKKSLEQIQINKEKKQNKKYLNNTEKKSELANEKSEVAEKIINKSNVQLKKFKNIYSNIERIEGLESIKNKFKNISILRPLQGNDEKNIFKERLNLFNELESYLQDNAGNIVNSIIEADVKSGKIKKNAEGKIIFKAPDSLYNKLISQFTNISPLVKQAFEPYILSSSPVLPIERDLISSVSGDNLDISKMRKIGEGKYMFGGKEFDISENGELTTYSVDKYGHKIELGNLGKDDLESLEDIKLEFSEKNKRLKNLGEEYNNKLIELRQAENEKPVDENKINELKRVLSEKKKRIEKLVKIIDELKKDLKEEKQKLSNFISKDKLEKVKKSEKILNDTGLSKFFPQSVIDEIFARINLSPSLRQELGFDTKIDFTEGELGFNKIGESENEYRRRFAKFVNSIISANENEPLDINQIGLGRIGYGENELSVKTMITENLTSGLIGYDIVKIFDNLKKSKQEKNPN